MIYFVAGTNDLYGVKVGNDGTFGEEKSVRVYETGYSAMTPEVYNGKVYVSGCVGTSPFSDKGYLAVVDVQSEQYKVNYIVELPAYAMGEMLVSKTGENSVRLYFTVNYVESDENYVPYSGGGIYSIEDTKGATSAKLETIYEPDKDHANYCMNSIYVDEDGTMYYINDSKTIRHWQKSSKHNTINIQCNNNSSQRNKSKTSHKNSKEAQESVKLTMEKEKIR